MPISNKFTSILSQDWEINFLQCYPNGYLKYTDLCNILQLTAGTHAELGGISFSDMQQFNQAWVLSKMRLEIKKLPKWKDVITVKTWIKNLENSRSTRCLEVYLNDEKIVGCETFWAVFNSTSRRPEILALPHEHFEKFPEINATKKSFSKIDLQQQFEKIAEKVVLLSDLDIVNHANSVKYLEWCLDYLDYDIIKNQIITSLEMNYLKEIAVHEKITIERNETTFAISKNEKTCFGLEINI